MAPWKISEDIEWSDGEDELSDDSSARASNLTFVPDFITEATWSVEQGLWRHLVKWRGYMESLNSWEPADDLTMLHTTEAYQLFWAAHGLPGHPSPPGTGDRTVYPAERKYIHRAVAAARKFRRQKKEDSRAEAARATAGKRASSGTYYYEMYTSDQEEKTSEPVTGIDKAGKTLRATSSGSFDKPRSRVVRPDSTDSSHTEQPRKRSTSAKVQPPTRPRSRVPPPFKLGPWTQMPELVELETLLRNAKPTSKVDAPAAQAETGPSIESANQARPKGPSTAEGPSTKPPPTISEATAPEKSLKQKTWKKTPLIQILDPGMPSFTKKRKAETGDLVASAKKSNSDAAVKDWMERASASEKSQAVSRPPPPPPPPPPPTRPAPPKPRAPPNSSALARPSLLDQHLAPPNRSNPAQQQQHQHQQWYGQPQQQQYYDPHQQQPYYDPYQQQQFEQQMAHQQQQYLQQQQQYFHPPPSPFHHHPPPSPFHPTSFHPAEPRLRGRAGVPTGFASQPGVGASPPAPIPALTSASTSPLYSPPSAAVSPHVSPPKVPRNPRSWEQALKEISEAAPGGSEVEGGEEDMAMDEPTSPPGWTPADDSPPPSPTVDLFPSPAATARTLPVLARPPASVPQAAAPAPPAPPAALAAQDAAAPAPIPARPGPPQHSPISFSLKPAPPPPPRRSSPPDASLPPRPSSPIAAPTPQQPVPPLSTRSLDPPATEIPLKIQFHRTRQFPLQADLLLGAVSLVGWLSDDVATALLGVQEIGLDTALSEHDVDVYLRGTRPRWVLSVQARGAGEPVLKALEAHMTSRNIIRSTVVSLRDQLYHLVFIPAKKASELLGSSHAVEGGVGVLCAFYPLKSAASLWHPLDFGAQAVGLSFPFLRSIAGKTVLLLTDPDLVQGSTLVSVQRALLDHGAHVFPRTSVIDSSSAVPDFVLGHSDSFLRSVLVLPGIVEMRRRKTTQFLSFGEGDGSLAWSGRGALGEMGRMSRWNERGVIFFFAVSALTGSQIRHVDKALELLADLDQDWIALMSPMLLAYISHQDRSFDTRTLTDYVLPPGRVSQSYRPSLFPHFSHKEHGREVRPKFLELKSFLDDFGHTQTRDDLHRLCYSTRPYPVGGSAVVKNLIDFDTLQELREVQMEQHFNRSTGAQGGSRTQRYRRFILVGDLDPKAFLDRSDLLTRVERITPLEFEDMVRERTGSHDRR